MVKNYIILAHTNPTQLQRLVERLDDSNTYFYIHLDLKCDIAEYQAKIDLPNVAFLEQREKCAWGDISLVNASLNGMRAVLKDGRKGYCILISGQDYPIKSNAAIDDYLTKNDGYDFVDLKPIYKLWSNYRMRGSINFYKFDLSTQRNDLVLIPSIFCKEFWSLYTLNNVWKVLKNGGGKLTTLLKNRNFPEYLVPYVGSQWWALTIETIEKILDFLEKHKDYMQYHRYSFCADEFLFHSIINYLSETGQVKLKTNLTFVNWKDIDDTSPQIIEASYFEQLIQMPDHQLFARKFDMEVDETIFDQLDNFISQPFQPQRNNLMAKNSQERPSATIEVDFDLITVNHHTFINALDHNSTVVDLGGNRGGFSKVILGLFSCKKVIVVEGNPQLIPVIKNNVLLYEEQVEVIPALIGPAYSEKVDFHLTEDPEASLVDKSLNHTQNFIKTVSVKMITMDYIYQRTENEKIDLLKVDIEGMEWEILNKLTKADFERIDQITVEFHDFLDPTLIYKTEEVIGHLTSLGYQYIEGKYESDAKYYDTLFCKPELYAKHITSWETMKNSENTSTNEKNHGLKHKLIQREEELVKQQNHHQKEIKTIHNSLSWKVTTPLRKISSLLGFK